MGEESLAELRFFRFELLVSVTGLLSTGAADVAVAGEDKEDERLLTWTDGVAGEPPDLCLVDRRDGVCCSLIGELALADLLFMDEGGVPAAAPPLLSVEVGDLGFEVERPNGDVDALRFNAFFLGGSSSSSSDDSAAAALSVSFSISSFSFSLRIDSLWGTPNWNWS